MNHYKVCYCKEKQYTKPDIGKTLIIQIYGNKIVIYIFLMIKLNLKIKEHPANKQVVLLVIKPKINSGFGMVYRLLL